VARHIFQACPVWIYTQSKNVIHLSTLHQHRKNYNETVLKSFNPPWNQTRVLQ
jgi:hypothetical protein